MEKEKVLNILRSSSNLPLDLVRKLLSDKDKDIKHEAWNYVILNVKNKEFLLELLSFHDTGTRYRAWNSVPEFVNRGILSLDEVMKRKEYFLEMLKDNNKVVRGLSWYVTLKPLLDMKVVSLEEVLVYSPFLCELVNSEFHEVVREVMEEFKITCKFI
ncbi:hypothetical protein [Sulfolobus sp. E11-6]|uniref:hypothetical protein n=1 Tax=Sulfolobus sp. E11-6 TaxID=2663020 RepID=UPI001294B86A|nr:hypothetical protein [Sulfolobus sp. E11-6]QGA69077.1 hypothetical protein GFS33_10520 [Sulfolobus sp. E11-6]